MLAKYVALIMKFCYLNINKFDFLFIFS